jgi:hypothetical protein
MGLFSGILGKAAGGLGKGAKFLHHLKVLKGLKTYAAKAKMRKTWANEDLGKIWRKEGLKGVVKYEFKELIKEKIVDLGTNIGTNIYNSLLGKNKEIHKLTDGLFKSATSKNLQNQKVNRAAKKKDLANYNKAINRSQNAIKRANAIKNDMNTAINNSIRNELLANIAGMNMTRIEIKHILEGVDEVNNIPVKQTGLNAIILLLEIGNQLKCARSLGKSIEAKVKIAELKGKMNAIKRTSGIMRSALSQVNSSNNDLMHTVIMRDTIGGTNGVFMTSPLAEEYDDNFFSDAIHMMNLYYECKTARVLWNVYSAFKSSQPKEDEELEQEVENLLGADMLGQGSIKVDISGEGAQAFLEKTFPALLNFKSKVAGIIEDLYLKLQNSDFNKNHPVACGVILDDIIPFLANIVLNPLAIVDGILPPMPTGFTAAQLADWVWKLVKWGFEFALSCNPWGMALLLTGFDLRLDTKVNFFDQLKLAIDGAAENIASLSNTILTLITGEQRTQADIAKAKYMGNDFSEIERNMYEKLREAEYVMHNYGYTDGRCIKFSNSSLMYYSNDGPLTSLIKGIAYGGPDIMTEELDGYEHTKTYGAKDSDRSLRQSLYVYKHDYIKTLTPEERERTGGPENFYGTEEEMEYEAALLHVAAIMDKADYKIDTKGRCTKDLMDRYSSSVGILQNLKEKWRKRWTPEYIKKLIESKKDNKAKKDVKVLGSAMKSIRSQAKAEHRATTLPINVKESMTQQKQQADAKLHASRPLSTKYEITDIQLSYSARASDEIRHEKDIKAFNDVGSNNEVNITGGSKTSITNNYYYR